MPAARILVVDDTAEVLVLMSKILKDQGYYVTQASDGRKAWAACQESKGQIDLLLTDITMPGMTGIELADSVKASYPAVRVLLVSGHCDADEIRTQISKKGFGFVSKPFMPQALINAVKDVLTTVKRGPYSAGLPLSHPTSKRA